ncbi:NAD(P)H-binding protein [Nocardiopsis sediminis]|uniref:NAD(P)H-binding protein n=1 Tax=Nocardiopsis sediminis TaxID=1778267 RepID=A0ABV8FUA0_9ACTN
MTILVTGASGNVGRHVVRGLVGAGQRVRAMTHSRGAEALPRGVEAVRADFADPATFGAALEGVERVYLFSGATAAFVDRARSAGVGRFVVHSAIAAGFPDDDDPDDTGLSPLRRHLALKREEHRAVERLAEASGAEWTHVRMGLLAVGALGWAAPIRAGEPVRGPYAGAGEPLVHEADVAEVAVAALLTDDHIGAAHALTGPAKVTQAEQVDAIGRATGRAATYEEIPPDQARKEWYDPANGMDHEVIDWILDLQAASSNGPGVIAPTTTYEQLTGRPPRTFTQWALDHTNDFR